MYVCMYVYRIILHPSVCYFRLGALESIYMFHSAHMRPRTVGALCSVRLAAEHSLYVVTLWNHFELHVPALMALPACL